MTYIDELKRKGIYADSTKGAEEHFESADRSLYCGFDGTAHQLHVGSLVPLTALATAIMRGHKVVVLLGGFTTRIGDPTGRDTARPELDEATIAFNLNSIRDSVQRLLPDAEFVDNMQWYRGMDYIEWAAEVMPRYNRRQLLRSKHFTIREDATFIEELYPLFQASDFKELYKRRNITAQIGGSDQYFNIVQAFKLVKEQLYGVTTKLLTDKSGNKIGKSSGHHNVSLTPDLISDILDNGGLEDLTYESIRELT